MAQTKNLDINFVQGLDKKTDPKQLGPGKFQELVNMVFSLGEALSKRNGYPLLLEAPANAAYLTTLNDNLLAIGNTISANITPGDHFSSSQIQLQPCSLEVVPLIRNNLNQICVDSVVSNEFVCSAYTSVISYSGGIAVSPSYEISIQSLATGQIISNFGSQGFPIPVIAGGVINGPSRVFVSGNLFVIVSPVVVASVTYLQYFTISNSYPFTQSIAVKVYADPYTPIISTPGWDGVVDPSGNLVISYNSPIVFVAQRMAYVVLRAADIIAHASASSNGAFSDPNYIGSSVSVCVDTTVSPNVFYINFWNNITTNGYCAAITLGVATINVQFTPVATIPTTVITNLASCAQSNICYLFFEGVSHYAFDAIIPRDFVPNNYVAAASISSTGVVVISSPFYALLGLGLASKAFIVNSEVYFMVAYDSPYQPSYFIINFSQTVIQTTNYRNFIVIVVCKIAYQNGGGYLPYVLPNVTFNGDTFYIPYLYKQDVESLNTLTNTQATATGGIYSQLGINLLSVTIGTQSISTIETARDLHLSGGFLSMFDGNMPVEHNFFVFPESIGAVFTASLILSSAGTFAANSFTITIAAGTSAFLVGMGVSDTTNPTYITAGTFITAIPTSTTITISKKTVNAGTGDTLNFFGNVASKPDGTTNANAYYYKAVYEWTDAQGNTFYSTPSPAFGLTTTGSTTNNTNTVYVPCLRITQKINVKIGIYRWSVQTQVYNQITSVMKPVLNNVFTDYITFVDVLSDAQVVGNDILYTTGGVLPDINGPASNIMTLFDTRLFMVDAEDPNLLWVSKTVIEKTPVEMSPYMTIYVAPNIGTVQSSGPMKALYPMDDKLIIFKNNSIFYMNGTGPDNLGTTSPGCPLGNYSPPTFITSIVGCTNPKSIVLIPDGLIFQTDKGLWLLSRDLHVSYIGAPVETFNSYTVTSAAVIPLQTFVVFTLSSGDILMYDFYYNQWGSWTGTTPIISGCIYDNQHTVLTSDGDILQQTVGNYGDNSSPVLIGLTTGWINLATVQGYQRFYEFYILASYLSPHTLTVSIAYDYNPTPTQTLTITPTTDSVEQWRVHMQRQTCMAFQLTLQENSSVPGAGLTISGMNLKVGLKKAMRPMPGSSSTS